MPSVQQFVALLMGWDSINKQNNWHEFYVKAYVSFFLENIHRAQTYRKQHMYLCYICLISLMRNWQRLRETTSIYD